MSLCLLKVINAVAIIVDVPSYATTFQLFLNRRHKKTIHGFFLQRDVVQFLEDHS